VTVSLDYKHIVFCC